MRPGDPVEPTARLGTDVSALVVVTDLDGTLLDEATYSFEAATDALTALKRRAARLILATSKTRAEMAPIASRLDLPAAFVVETGGAVILPASLLAEGARDSAGDPEERVIVLGTPREILVEQLASISDVTRVPLRGFAQLSVEAISNLTGLPIDAARLAGEREYDEPFLIEDPSLLPLVDAESRRRGLIVTRGGRFAHLTGPSDKGRAVRVALDLLRQSGRPSFTIGLGDAPNDASFLAIVDQAVIIPRRGNRVDPELAALVPRACRAPAPGPEGWNAAVLALLEGRTLPRV